MYKPKNWEETTADGEFEPLGLGGHICRIMKVEEMQSQTGKDMIKISLDIAEGEQKGYSAEQYRKDTRENKRWGCTVYQLLEDRDGNTNKGFKTFVRAVEKSNPGFNSEEIWNERFCSYFKDKLVGGVFGREQYKGNDGKLKWSTKCVQFRDTDTIKKGVPVPADKYLEGHTSIDIEKEYSEISSDDDLPF